MEKSYLVKRNNVLYFRMAVLKAFRNHIPGREIKYFLKETDLQMAERKCSLLGEKLLELFKKTKTEEVIMAALHPLIKRICANILFFGGRSHLRQYSIGQYTPEECGRLISCIQSLYRNQNTDNHVAEKFRKMFLRENGINYSVRQYQKTLRMSVNDTENSFDQ